MEKSEQLKADLRELDFMLHNPIFYLVKYFEDIRNKIDIACEVYLQQEPGDLNKALECQYLMISELKEMEDACLCNLKLNKLEPSLVLRAEVGIDKIECEIKRVDFNRDKNWRRMDEIVELIYERIFVMVQRAILMNRAVLFLSESFASDYVKEMCCDVENKSVCSLFGVMFVVEDSFISENKFEARVKR